MQVKPVWQVEARPAGPVGFDGDGSVGDGGKPPATIDATNPEVKKLLDDAVAGLKTNRDAILAEKAKLQERLSALETQWKDLDPEQVRTFMTRMGQDEEMKLIAAGKIDEAFSRRTEALRKDLERRVDASTGRVTELEKELTSTQSTIKALVVDGAIRDAAAKLSLAPTAIEDAVMRGRSVFSVDENRLPVARDAGGVILMSKDGKTPLGPAEWLVGMRETAPHWWPPSAGGGANGGGGAGRVTGGLALDKLSAEDKLAVGLVKQASAAA